MNNPRFDRSVPSREIAETIGAMVLECHDAEEPTLAARCGHLDGSIAYDYQAEEWVQESAIDYPHLVRWVLYDALGQRAEWQRRDGAARLVSSAERYTGEGR